MPCSRANDSPAASGRLAITAATCAGQPSAAQRCTMACMLEPRPEIRMTMRFMTAREVYVCENARLPLSTGSASMRPRVLSGMRPTGSMHLGHYHGALKNWVRLQDTYDCFYFVADWHALTTHYEDREVIEK